MAQVEYKKLIGDDETHIGYEVKTSEVAELIEAFCWKGGYKSEIDNKDFDPKKPVNDTNQPIIKNPTPPNAFALGVFANMGINTLQEYRTYKSIVKAKAELPKPIEVKFEANDDPSK